MTNNIGYGEPLIKMVINLIFESKNSLCYAIFYKLFIGLQYSPKVITTDKLRSYGAAKRRLGLSIEHGSIRARFLTHSKRQGTLLKLAY